MKILFLNGYTEDEKKIIIPSVHANVLGNIKDILKGVQKYKLVLPPDIQVSVHYFYYCHKTYY